VKKSLCSTLALFAATLLSVTVWVAGPAYAQSRGNLPEVGEVVFATGEAKILPANMGPNGQGMLSAAKGTKVAIGDRLETGSGGHIHVRFVDNAFVSVRPGSSLQVQDYAFDAANPGQSKVKFALTSGTSRFITGKAGQAAKQNFRLNTPISAIGVRGTDFVVQTTQDITRVAVYQGAIVASPFDANCSAQALGPCSGGLARDLAGSLTNQYLEIKQASVPELIKPKNGAAGRIFVPANPNEPSAGKPTSSNGSLNGGVAAGGEKVIETRVPAGYAGSEAIIWGRWNAANGLPSGYELIGREGDLALLRAKGNADLPSDGKINLRLDSVVAYGTNRDGELKAADVRNASMAVNFNTMQYATKFRWEFENQAQSFASKGAIQSDGRLEADRNKSNFDLYGSLDLAGNEAAYIFLKRSETSAINALGVLHWKR
jgi:FecR protein